MAGDDEAVEAEEPPADELGGAPPSGAIDEEAPSSKVSPRRVKIDAWPENEGGLRRVSTTLALAVGVPLSDAQLLLDIVPLEVPHVFEAEDADELVEKLNAAGASARALPTPRGRIARCEHHPGLDANQQCEQCGEGCCLLCGIQVEGTRCLRCAKKWARGRTFRRVRIGVLLLILAAVMVFAYRQETRRKARNDWRKPVRVAVVLLRIGDVDPEALHDFQAGLPELQEHLRVERARYGDGPMPFDISGYGPVSVPRPPPLLEGNGKLDLVKHQFEMWRYLRKVDAAAGVASSSYGSRIYVVTRPPASSRRSFVEGLSEQGGFVGTVSVELDPKMVNYALFVTAHELFHTMGATDKYHPTGETMVPSGLAEPKREPLYPQKFIEIMARSRPVTSNKEVLPDSFEELRVGEKTAAEIGWR